MNVAYIKYFTWIIKIMKLTPEKMAAFCAALAETGIVARACEAVGIARQTAYEWRAENPKFKENWNKALEIGITALEDEAHRRGFEGVDKPVFYQGVACGAVREYSDTLAIFLLKAHSPEKYRERHDVNLTADVNIADAIYAARKRGGVIQNQPQQDVIKPKRGRPRKK